MRYFRLFRNLSNWYLYLAVKFSLTDRDPLLFRARNRIFIEVPRRLLHEFKEIFMEQCYTRGLGMPIPDSPTVIDIGANAGFFSLFAASRFHDPRILSFETIESNFGQLRRNRDLNRNCNMSCHNQAVFGHHGEILLTYSRDDGFTTSATVLGKFSKDDITVQVPCITLDEIFKDNGLKNCDLLKMDCEGSEYSILYNCPREHLSWIGQMAIEVHQGSRPEQNIEVLTEYLRGAGFQVRRHDHMVWAWHE